ncbi:MAG TPA: phosphoenolpyruvate--protein phosphotransferase [Gammaproteobacteria bacterium]|nr:phosphoenolpyruvate--protein phosphotransferase [Gammaproteobacteria bacterium]
MLETLRRIVQEVTAAQDLPQALNLIVQRIKQVMNTDVCSIYLADISSQQHVLMATDGLNPQAVGRIRIEFNKGLISRVAELAEPVNLDSAQNHPDYVFLPNTREENYHGFLGAPIIHHGEVLGVIAVQQTKKRSFVEDELTLLVTIAAQLAGVIAHAEAIGELTGLHGGHRLNPDKPFKGIPGAPGVAIGASIVVYPAANLDAVPNRRTDDIEAEIAVFNTAVEETREDLLALKKRIVELPQEDQALFDAYLLILESKNLINKTLDRIKKGYWASTALRDTVLEHVSLFSSMEDVYLSERSQDVRDLGKRILMHIQSDTETNIAYNDATILVSDELTAPSLMEIPKDKLVAVVSSSGSGSSHVAILARAMGIPAVMGATDLPINQLDGKTLVVDGYQGNVYVEPSNLVISEFKKIIEEENELSLELKKLKDLPAETTDGVHIPLYINSGLVSDLTSSQSSGAEGIGLYRTEFPFMIRDRFPGEDEQTKIYRQVLSSYSPNPVVLRTLDIGGDKSLNYFPIEEENPFLGWRGIRISLDHPDIFTTQLKAMLRASIGLDNLNILFPMITRVSEINSALKLTRKAHRELQEDGYKNVKMPRIGAMLEVPSAVFQTNVIAKRVDYISIGTNDLVQYILAVDRNNPSVAGLYDCLHPSVIQAVKHVVRQAELHNTPVSVCGEMAGDPAAVILLLGMGLDNLSMSVVALPKIKWVIRNFSFKQAQNLLQEVEHYEEAVDVRNRLNKALEKSGLGGLIHPGKH